MAIVSPFLNGFGLKRTYFFLSGGIRKVKCTALLLKPADGLFGLRTDSVSGLYSGFVEARRYFSAACIV
jgi:hypothetical protein